MEGLVKSIQWGKSLVKSIAIYSRLDSSNEFAKRYLKNGGSSGTVIWALQQTKGKGRRGRSWQSDAGSLTFSLLWQCPQKTAPANITLAIGLGLVQVLAKLVPDLKVKWPNDLYVGEEKLGGILSESMWHEGKLWLIIGIGLNVNSAPVQMGINSTSLRDVTGIVWSRLAILDRALLGIERGMALAAEKEDLNDLFRIHGNFLQRPILVHHGNQTFAATARAVLADGRLLIEDARGTRALLPEEITLRIG